MMETNKNGAWEGKLAMAVDTQHKLGKSTTVEQHTAETFTAAGLGVQSHMYELRQRESKWWTRGKMAGLIAGGAGVLAAVAACAAYVLWPDSVSLSDLDVPSQIAAALPAPGSGVGGSIRGSFDLVATDLTSKVVSLGLMLGAAWLLAGIALWAIYETSLKYAMSGAAILGACVVMGTFGGAGTQDVQDRQGARAISFVKASGFSSTPPGLYVLAQEALSHSKLDDKDIAVVKAAAQSLQGVTPDFVPQPRLVALIEQAAYGKARSPAAIQYEATTSTRRAWLTSLTTLLTTLGVTAAAASIALCLLGRSVGRRRKRLLQSMGALRAKDVGLDRAE